MVGADSVRKKLGSLQFTMLYSGRLGVMNGIAQYEISVSAASIPNFQDLTVDNFILNVNSITGSSKTGENTGAKLKKSYNSATGLFKIDVSVSGQSHAFIECDLICVHV